MSTHPSMQNKNELGVKRHASLVLYPIIQDKLVSGRGLLCPRIDPLRFLAGCRRRRLNHGLVIALGFFLVVRWGMFLCYFFRFMGACLVRYLFVSVPV